jgi:hypothetical protein
MSITLSTPLSEIAALDSLVIANLYGCGETLGSNVDALAQVVKRC